jgi:hypothetical protein
MRAELSAHGENTTSRNLFADVELLNDLAISVNVFFHQIVQQATSLSDELQQAQAAVVVFLV